MSTTKIATLGKVIDFEALAARARRTNLVSLEASEDEALTMREITGEQLLEFLEDAGAQVEVLRDPTTGEIDEIHASVGISEGDEPSVICEIHATVSPSKILGDLAQTSVSTTINTTITGTTGQSTCTLGSSTGVLVGASISGAALTAGTTITALNGVTATLSQPLIATPNGQPCVITNEQQVIGLAEWTLSWKRKTADATTTDNNTYESSLGSTASWSVKAKYMFIDADPSQAQNILATITSPQSPLQWNFFPTLGTGRSAFTGQAYVDGIDMSTGMGKVVGLDVSLKGTGQLTFTVQVAPVTNNNTQTGEQAEV